MRARYSRCRWWGKYVLAQTRRALCLWAEWRGGARRDGGGSAEAARDGGLVMQPGRGGQGGSCGQPRWARSRTTPQSRTHVLPQLAGHAAGNDDCDARIAQVLRHDVPLALRSYMEQHELEQREMRHHRNRPCTLAWRGWRIDQ